jgi:hypothetical protein
VLAATVLVAGVAGWVLLPNGDYAPVQSAERGTLQGGLRQFAAVHTGRPSLTPEREEELGGAPWVRDEDDREGRPTETETTPTETGETETGLTTTEPAATTTATTTVQGTTTTETTTTP